jgi:hypothetical protein
MLPPMLATETVVVECPVLVNERGSLIPDWSQPPRSSVSVTGCSVQPNGSTEDTQSRQNVRTSWVVYMPPGGPVGAFDAVRIRGVLCLIVGQPEHWLDPRGQLDHVRVHCVAQDG